MFQNRMQSYNILFNSQNFWFENLQSQPLNEFTTQKFASLNPQFTFVPFSFSNHLIPTETHLKRGGFTKSTQNTGFENVILP
jgi:hypothetical protein